MNLDIYQLKTKEAEWNQPVSKKDIITFEIRKFNQIERFDIFNFKDYPCLSDNVKPMENILYDGNEYLIKNSNNYYCFADYNFGGGYWFINLSKTDLDYGNILLVYDFLNLYYECCNTIEDFFKELIENEPEALLK